ncbi:MAG TPA: hypothetical protein VG323_15725 [Thermoanaerobaculia bacterium]|nr:hypothetical protein [Thermoanaerobaculia bacterium]
MPEHEALNPETHHETSDVDVRGILWFVVIFIAFAIVTHVVLYFLFNYFAREFRRDIQPARTAIRVPAAVPQTPRLQPFPQQVPPYANTPVTDMTEMHESEEQALKNPGWIDKEHGVVRIPIERAKQMVVQLGGKL